MRKNIVCIVAGVFLMLFISTAFAEDVVLQYWMWDPEIKDMEREFLNKFEESHPGIKIELTAIAPKEYWTKLAAMAAAGKIPDVVNMHPNSVEDFVAQNALVDLTPYIEKDFKKEDYAWSVMESSFDVDGKYYGVPFAWVGTVVFYNKTMFDEAGLEYPQEGWTWDDFLEDAKALTKDTDGDGTIDTWGYVIFGRYAVADGWFLQNDGELLDRENHKFAPNENAIETLQFLADLIHVHKVAPLPKSMDLDKKKMKIVFANSQVGIVTGGSWNIEHYRNVSPVKDEWDLAQVPRGPHWKEDVMHAWADGMAISAASEHPAEAWEFIKYMVNDRPAEQYYAGKIPFYNGQSQSEAFDDWKSRNLQPEHKIDLVKFGQNAQHFYTKFWKQWRGYGSAERSGMSDKLNDLFNGDISVDEFVSQTAKLTNRILKRGYR
ncbi:MAG: sugar ABC transporter substrate-binding protein [bacterium]|nr:sugar ABC transporter substrate-binding protein [bacterium]